MIDLFEVLPACYPSSLYMWVGVPTNQNELDECLTWMSDDPKPTWQELETAWENELASRSAVEQLKEDSRQSALAKLERLGLTLEEAKAVIGI
jgi:hypothetical protein